jgi:thermitase
MREKLLLFTLMTGLFAMSGYLIWENFVDDGADANARFTSLGVPQEIKMDTKKELKVILSDPAVSKNWGLMGTGGASDIKAFRAWEITQGSRDIRVAVIDTGADTKHPDLKNNLWINKGETGTDRYGRNKATNKVDDDGNGFVDDVNGWNFVGDNHDLADHHGHGTHIAGILGAEGGNGIGISGVSPNVSIMVLKYYDPNSRANDNLSNTIKAIRYAIKMKAHIINYSGGGVEYSAEEFRAVEEAHRQGILFVAAAGNERSNSDISHYYPADYGLPNIISVTAINPNAQVLASSNYGMKSVHIAAPGEGIFSTLPGSKYGLMTGTSQATSFVSGVAALIMAANRSFNYTQVKNQILSTADELSNLRSKTKTSGKLNSWAALAIQPSLPITGVAATSGSNSDVFAAPSGAQAAVEADNLTTLTTLMKNLERQPVQKN